MMGAVVIQFPNSAPSQFTSTALALARDVVDGKQDLFWGAVIVLAESPVKPDRDRAAQILDGYQMAMAVPVEPEPFEVAPESTPSRVLRRAQWIIAGLAVVTGAAVAMRALLGVVL